MLPDTTAQIVARLHGQQHQGGAGTALFVGALEALLGQEAGQGMAPVLRGVGVEGGSG